MLSITSCALTREKQDLTTEKREWTDRQTDRQTERRREKEKVCGAGSLVKRLKRRYARLCTYSQTERKVWAEIKKL
jgi:hypothetical protein